MFKNNALGLVVMSFVCALMCMPFAHGQTVIVYGNGGYGASSTYGNGYSARSSSSYSSRYGSSNYSQRVVPYQRVMPQARVTTQPYVPYGGGVYGSGTTGVQVYGGGTYGAGTYSSGYQGAISPRLYYGGSRSNYGTGYGTGYQYGGAGVGTMYGGAMGRGMNSR